MSTEPLRDYIEQFAATIKNINLTLQKLQHLMSSHTVTLPGGQVLHNTHSIASCYNEDSCPIHKPSIHHMRRWHQQFDYSYDFKKLMADIGASKAYVSGVPPQRYMWRVCMHDVRHIDPDEPFWEGDGCPCGEQTACCIPPNLLTIVPLSTTLDAQPRG